MSWSMSMLCYFDALCSWSTTLPQKHRDGVHLWTILDEADSHRRMETLLKLFQLGLRWVRMSSMFKVLLAAFRKLWSTKMAQSVPEQKVPTDIKSCTSASDLKKRHPSGKASLVTNALPNFKP